MATTSGPSSSECGSRQTERAGGNGTQGSGERPFANLSHIYFPTHSNGFKDVGRYLGSSWSEPEASGIQSIVWRSRWEVQHRRGVEAGSWSAYNTEDCAALKRVTEVVYATWDRGNGTTEHDHLDCRNNNPVERVQNAAELPGEGPSAQGNFAHPDYEYLNRCRWVDYQRQRVYAQDKQHARERVGEKNNSLRVCSKRGVSNEERV